MHKDTPIIAHIVDQSQFRHQRRAERRVLSGDGVCRRSRQHVRQTVLQLPEGTVAVLRPLLFCRGFTSFQWHGTSSYVVLVLRHAAAQRQTEAVYPCDSPLFAVGNIQVLVGTYAG